MDQRFRAPTVFTRPDVAGESIVWIVAGRSMGVVTGTVTRAVTLHRPVERASNRPRRLSSRRVVSTLEKLSHRRGPRNGCALTDFTFRGPPTKEGKLYEEGLVGT